MIAEMIGFKILSIGRRDKLLNDFPIAIVNMFKLMFEFPLAWALKFIVFKFSWLLLLLLLLLLLFTLFTRLAAIFTTRTDEAMNIQMLMPESIFQEYKLKQNIQRRPGLFSPELPLFKLAGSGQGSNSPCPNGIYLTLEPDGSLTDPKAPLIKVNNIYFISGIYKENNIILFIQHIPF